MRVIHFHNWRVKPDKCSHSCFYLTEGESLIREDLVKQRGTIERRQERGKKKRERANKVKVQETCFLFPVFDVTFRQHNVPQ